MKTKNFIVIAFTSALLYSCGTDPCEDVDCGNGVCVEGDCVCDTGYENAYDDGIGYCDREIRGKFLGSFSSKETCADSTHSYENTISESSEGITSISISNFYGYANNTVKATVDGTNLTIEDQTTADNFQVSGSGSINEDHDILTIDFIIKDITNGTDADTCTVVMTRP